MGDTSRVVYQKVEGWLTFAALDGKLHFLYQHRVTDFGAQGEPKLHNFIIDEVVPSEVIEQGSEAIKTYSNRVAKEKIEAHGREKLMRVNAALDKPEQTISKDMPI